jgi:tetratricopeptide (TPR) repeat protein
MSTHGVLTGLLAVFVLAGCGRRTSVIAPAAGPTPDSLYAEGLAAFHLGTPDGYRRAADIFRMASKTRPERCEYALSAAQSLLFLATERLLNWEEYEPLQAEALALVDSVAPACGVSHEAFVLRLRALIAGRGPTATELINRAVDLDPTDAMNWLVLGYLDPVSRHLTTSQGAGRWIAMSRAAELQPESALIQYELGKNLQATSGKEVQARTALQRATELSPGHFRAYLALAFSADDTTDPEPLYQKVVEIAPNFLEGRIALGSYYGALEENEKASEQYAAAIAINPRYDTAHFRLGLLMLQLEHLADAESHFKKVIELNAGAYEAHYYVGNILYGQKEHEEAKREYERALSIRVNYPEAIYGIGWVYRQQDEPDRAAEEFDRVIRLQPRYCDAYISRGDIRVERHQLHEATADYQKAIECYEDQLRSLNATIALAEARPESRMMQSEKKRAERDKARTEAILERARSNKSEIEEKLHR